MCGIAGFVDLDGRRSGEEAAARVRAMAATMAHRGPDGDGVWTDAAAGIALAHRRLAVIDVSAAGAQPMVSPSGRYVTVVNGEIYNFEELRQDLSARGHRFRGHSDTEVMLALVDEVGLAAAIERMVGMFALAVWDRQARTLHLARDRFGEKPLYWGSVRGGRTVVFGSELKAVRAHPDVEPRVDRAALTQFVRHGWIPAPRSILCGIGKLPAGSHVTIEVGAGRVGSPVPYYSLAAVARRGRAETLDVGPDEAADLVEASLRRAIRRQMVADVPLGAFLSGGIDSSTVVAMMQAESARPVRTFTIGFHERAHDEARFAAGVARALGTDHAELYASPDDARQLIPELPAIYDEPFADSSQLPTILLSRRARADVTVALTGDGGDEVFGGYSRYAVLRRVAHLYGLPGRRVVSRPAHALLAAVSRRLPMHAPVRPAIEWIRRRVAFAGAADLDTFYRSYLSSWPAPETLVTGSREPPGLLPLRPEVLPLATPTERAMLVDTLLYLPEDILVKVDRAAMSAGLETRVPMLDPAVVELAWRLPYRAKIQGARGKVVLRRVLARHLPPSLLDRPKHGFAVPIGAWLRGPLREWAEALLHPRRLRSEGFLDPAAVTARWREHLAGVRDWHFSLWIVLTWQAWLEATGTPG